MTYEATGSGDVMAKSESVRTRLAAPAETGNDSVSAYRSFFEGGSGGSASTRQREDVFMSAGRPRPRKITRESQVRRDAFRRGIHRAIADAKAMCDAAALGDATLLSNMGYMLRDTLQGLWDLRSEREEDWADILNTLQIVVEGSQLDDLTADQCRAIMAVIGEHLALHEVDAENLEAATLTLVKAGLDPWKGMAESPQSEIRSAEPLQ